MVVEKQTTEITSTCLGWWLYFSIRVRVENGLGPLSNIINDKPARTRVIDAGHDKQRNKETRQRKRDALI